jgi:hypothetical protein
MKKPKATKAARFFSALIRTAYLPQEVPPAITTRYFADFCRDNFAFLKAQQGSLMKTTTNYETFTAPRAKSGRRNLALVHPLAQTNISLLITQHRKPIKDLISKSTTSLYRTEDDLGNSIAFLGLDFSQRHPLQAKTASEYPFILSADISRFFYTVYTHSIPWAVIGKEKAKHWLISDRSRLSSHWSDELDRALQAGQSRETFGIPVGPDTSRIVAEVLFAGIESDEQLAPFLRDRIAFRLVDDLTVGFESEEDAYRALAALRNALWKFNLQLNEEKTFVSRSRQVMRERWELDHEAFLISDTDVNEQAIQLARFFELTFHFCSSSGTDTPALWTCRRISQLKNIKENFELILDGLFRLAREFPRSMTYVTSILINNQDFCSKPDTKKRIERWCRSTIKTHVRHGHDFEVAWSLVVCGVLKIKLHKSDLDGEMPVPSPTILALLGLLHEKGLLTNPLSTWPWKSKIKKLGVLDSYWLPFYESVRRGWSKDKNLVRAVNAHPVLARMLASKVTFLEDRIFDAAQINISSRIFRSRGARIKTVQSIEKYRAMKKELGPRGFGSIKLTIQDLDY